MPLTLEKIVEEVRDWPENQVAELVDELQGRLHGITPEEEADWSRTAGQRLRELREGTVQPIPGDTTAAKVRLLVGL
ncbi:MAG: addiction module antitoxin RelB [Limisphaerales bacterium]